MKVLNMMGSTAGALFTFKCDACQRYLERCPFEKHYIGLLIGWTEYHFCDLPCLETWIKNGGPT